MEASSRRRPRRISLYAILVVLLTAALISLEVRNSLPSRAQDVSDVMLQVTPATVRIKPDDEAKVVAVLHNGSNESLRRINLIPVLPTGLTMDQPRSFRKLLPHASLVVTFHLRHTTSGSLPATGLLEADFRRSADGTPITQTIVQAFEIKGQEAESTDQIAKVELKGSGAVLDEFDEADLVTVVTNSSVSPITITKIEPRAPATIEFNPGEVLRNITLAPNHQRAIRFHMSIADGAAVRSGENLVLVQTDVAWGSGNRRKLSLTATQTVKLGVFAESDIAEIAKIPSLLFLPGFMLLMAIALLVKLPRIRLAKVGDAITTSPAIFGFLMVPASLLTLGVYWLWTQRDVRYGYNFNDVVQVSLVGIALAIVMVFVGQVATLIWIAWSRLSVNDDPIAALEKLGRQRKGLRLREVTIKNSTHTGLLYEGPREGSTKAIVGPWICIDYPSRDAELQERINGYRNDGRDPRGLARLLKEVTESRARARWKPADNSAITRLMEIDKDRFETTETESEVVEEC